MAIPGISAEAQRGATLLNELCTKAGTKERVKNVLAATLKMLQDRLNEFAKGRWDWDTKNLKFIEKKAGAAKSKDFKSFEDIAVLKDEKIAEVVVPILVAFGNTVASETAKILAGMSAPPTPKGGRRKSNVSERKRANAQALTEFFKTKIQTEIPKGPKKGTLGTSFVTSRLETLFRQIIAGDWSIKKECALKAEKSADEVSKENAALAAAALVDVAPAAAAAPADAAEPDSPTTPHSPKLPATPPPSRAATGAAAVTPPTKGSPATPTTAENNEMMEGLKKDSDASAAAANAAFAARDRAIAVRDSVIDAVGRGITSLKAQSDKTLKAADGAVNAASALAAATKAEAERLNAATKPAQPTVKPAPAPSGASTAAAKPSVKAAGLPPASPAKPESEEQVNDDVDAAPAAADAPAATADTATDVSATDAAITDADVEIETEVKKDEKTEKPTSFLSKFFCFIPNLFSRFFKWLFGMKS